MYYNLAASTLQKEESLKINDCIWVNYWRAGISTGVILMKFCSRVTFYRDFMEEVNSCKNPKPEGNVAFIVHYNTKHCTLYENFIIFIKWEKWALACDFLQVLLKFAIRSFACGSWSHRRFLTYGDPLSKKFCFHLNGRFFPQNNTGEFLLPKLLWVFNTKILRRLKTL